jgi:hypothetical protein
VRRRGRDRRRSRPSAARAAPGRDALGEEGGVVPTQPNSAELRVCCQIRPGVWSPGDGVTPRDCRMRPRSSTAPGTSTHESSVVKPVAPHAGGRQVRVTAARLPR